MGTIATTGDVPTVVVVDGESVKVGIKVTIKVVKEERDPRVILDRKNTVLLMRVEVNPDVWDKLIETEDPVLVIEEEMVLTGIFQPAGVTFLYIVTGERELLDILATEVLVTPKKTENSLQNPSVTTQLMLPTKTKNDLKRPEPLEKLRRKIGSSHEIVLSMNDPNTNLVRIHTRETKEGGPQISVSDRGNIQRTIKTTLDAV